MAISLYDVSCTNFLQCLGAVEGILEKGKQHLSEQGEDLADIVEMRLIDDMNPFRFQVISVAHHSMGALKGVAAGEFAPPEGYGEPDYAGLQALVAEAKAYVVGLSPDEVNGWEGKDMNFSVRGNQIPFVAENFLQTFSMPNLFFHAATTYDMLRMKGVPLGKRDFLGAMRMKS